MKNGTPNPPAGTAKNYGGVWRCPSASRDKTAPTDDEERFRTYGSLTVMGLGYPATAERRTGRATVASPIETMPISINRRKQSS
ncbi:MAG: hypothetical protein H7Y38_16110 [Armatimonadetes bacterium]|nr:hypothetical protein [Armatimonadota bacterium]